MISLINWYIKTGHNPHATINCQLKRSQNYSSISSLNLSPFTNIHRITQISVDDIAGNIQSFLLSFYDSHIDLRTEQGKIVSKIVKGVGEISDIKDFDIHWRKNQLPFETIWVLRKQQLCQHWNL
ncbi:unnamed protein product [Ambrosiozyma monospora]|uniref:Unnamed protein product n=1 Tax=Ambrosiozyma monospora TaxID=43982 RepID=A0ACB5T9F7_AMBMO|nr:unnamed protein product [Ambrosiozyma monospora]